MRYVIVTDVDKVVLAKKIEQHYEAGYVVCGELSHTKINHGWTQTDNPSVEYVEPIRPEGEETQFVWYQYHYAQVMIKP